MVRPITVLGEDDPGEEIKVTTVRWNVPGVDERTKRLVRVFAAEGGITLAQALREIVPAGIAAAASARKPREACDE